MRQSRRKFLKLLLIGSFALVLGKIFGSKLLASDNSKQLPPGKEIALGDFRIVDSGNRLNFFNKKGERVFALHEDGTLEIGEHTIRLSKDRLDMDGKPIRNVSQIDVSSRLKIPVGTNLYS